MTLLLGSEINKNVIQNFFDKNKEEFPDMHITKEYTNSLKKYLSRLQNFNHLEYIIVDLSVITDDAKDLIDSLIRLHTMLGENDTRIIIIAIGINNNAIISDLIRNQIFNIVIGENDYIIESHIRKCFSKSGMKYSEISKLVNQKQEKATFFKKILNRISFLKNSQNDGDYEVIYIKNEPEHLKEETQAQNPLEFDAFNYEKVDLSEDKDE